jgi:hypothetical protein
MVLSSLPFESQCYYDLSDKNGSNLNLLTINVLVVHTEISSKKKRESESDTVVHIFNTRHLGDRNRRITV